MYPLLRAHQIVEHAIVGISSYYFKRNSAKIINHLFTSKCSYYCQTVSYNCCEKKFMEEARKRKLPKFKYYLCKKAKSDYSYKEKFAKNYYSKLMPFVYNEFLGILGFLKYIFSWIMGLFKPTYRQLIKSDMHIVAHKSAGLAAKTFMLSMAAKNYDTCPMEGIDSFRIKKTIKFAVKQRN